MTKKNHIKNLTKFNSGEVLKSQDLNNIYSTLAKIAQQAGMNLVRRHIWVSGSILTSESLNNLLEDVALVFNFLGLERPTWSFGRFKNGTTLKAEHLNEIVDRIQTCAKKIGS